MNAACRSHFTRLDLIVLTMLGTADYEARYVGLVSIFLLLNYTHVVRHLRRAIC
jgi:hypothetical protein